MKNKTGPLAVPQMDTLAEHRDPQGTVGCLDERRLRYSDLLKNYFGGASRDRTDDLIVANDALSQLSYSPTKVGRTFLILRHFANARISGQMPNRQRTRALTA